MSGHDHTDLVEQNQDTLQLVSELEARGLWTKDRINIAGLIYRLDVMDGHAHTMQDILTHLPSFPFLTQTCEMLHALLGTIARLRQQHGDQIPTDPLRSMCAELRSRATETDQSLKRRDIKQTICRG
jgi:hypothetical protein